MKAWIERVFIDTINTTIKGDNYQAARKHILEHPARLKMFENLEREIKDAGVVLDEMTGDADKKRRAIEDLVKGLSIAFAKTALGVKERELKDNSFSAESRSPLDLDINNSN